MFRRPILLLVVCSLAASAAAERFVVGHRDECAASGGSECRGELLGVHVTPAVIKPEKEVHAQLQLHHHVTLSDVAKWAISLEYDEEEVMWREMLIFYPHCINYNSFTVEPRPKLTPIAPGVTNLTLLAVVRDIPGELSLWRLRTVIFDEKEERVLDVRFSLSLAPLEREVHFADKCDEGFPCEGRLLRMDMEPRRMGKGDKADVHLSFLHEGVKLSMYSIWEVRAFRDGKMIMSATYRLWEERGVDFGSFALRMTPKELPMEDFSSHSFEVECSDVLEGVLHVTAILFDDDRSYVGSVVFYTDAGDSHES